MTSSAGRCSFRAAQALMQAKQRDPQGTFTQEYQALQSALRSTSFGQAFEPSYVERLLPKADCVVFAAGTELDLSAEKDGLYVLVSGSAEFVSPSRKRTWSLHLSILSGSSLIGDSDLDRLDPYVIINVGQRSYSTPVAEDAGPNPMFNWSETISYEGESELHFTVMEHDQFSRDDVLGHGTLSKHWFEMHDFEGSVHLRPPEKGRGAKLLTGDITADEGKAGFLTVRASLGPEIVTQQPPDAGAARQQAATGGENERQKVIYNKAQESARKWMQRLERFSLASLGGAEAAGAGAGPADPKGLFAPRRKPIRFGPGEYFGAEEGGGVVRLLESSTLLFVPRGRLKAEMVAFRQQQRKEQQSFLRKWVPGAQGLDKRTFEGFTGYFQVATFPRSHTLCSAGSPSPSGGTPRIYIIRAGTCRILKASGDREPWRVPGHSAPIGLLGEGSVVGYASTLFGVPEPFTVVTDEPVTALWINVSERPINTWPRDVVSKLHDQLKAQTEWHGRRTRSVAAAEAASGNLFADKGPGTPAWVVTDSPYLRHKELSAWQLEHMRERFCDETALSLQSRPSSRSSNSSGLHRSASAPNATGKLHRSGSTVRRPDSSSSGAEVRPMTTGSTTTERHLQSTLHAGPWGTWSTSGPLEARAAATRRAKKARAEASVRASATSGKPGSLLAASSAADLEGGRDKARPRLNLNCESDWKVLNGMASSVALGKMYRQQLRHGTVSLGPLGARATGDRG